MREWAHGWSLPQPGSAWAAFSARGRLAAQIARESHSGGRLEAFEIEGVGCDMDHRLRACSTLCSYCIYELRMSEDTASRRVAAARLVRRYPQLLDAIESGELHLTGLLMLGPHLTLENCARVLLQAKHRTKKELEKLVRELDPLPDVPARIEPLGSAPARNGFAPRNPTWREVTRAMCPVRELRPEDRPRNWLEDGSSIWEGDRCDGGPEVGPEPAVTQPTMTELAPEQARPWGLVDPPFQTRSQRYKVQFTATEEYVQLLERAKALLSHALPSGTLEEIQLRAMRALVAQLEKRRYGVLTPTLKAAPHASDASSPASVSEELRSEDPRQRGRYVPAAVRRAVFARDGDRCTYLDVFGRRCHETRYLELHHLRAFARGGGHTLTNLALRCRAHNALAAEEDFGKTHMHACISSGEARGSG